MAAAAVYGAAQANPNHYDGDEPGRADCGDAGGGNVLAPPPRAVTETRSRAALLDAGGALRSSRAGSNGSRSPPPAAMPPPAHSPPRPPGPPRRGHWPAAGGDIAAGGFAAANAVVHPYDTGAFGEPQSLLECDYIDADELINDDVYDWLDEQTTGSTNRPIGLTVIPTKIRDARDTATAPASRRRCDSGRDVM